MKIFLNRPFKRLREDKFLRFCLSPHIPDCVSLLNEALFSRLKAVLLRLELSRGTTIAAETGQSVVESTLPLPWGRIHKMLDFAASSIAVMTNSLERFHHIGTFLRRI